MPPLQAVTERLSLEATESPTATTSIDHDSLVGLLDDDTWFAAPADEAYRWRHWGVDEALAGRPVPVAQLRKLTQNANPVIAANAAIALARSGDGTAAPQLIAAVQQTRTRLPLRLAAAESLSGVSTDQIRALVDEASGTLDAARRNPDLHAQLLRALAAKTSPSAEPRLQSALRSPDQVVRLAAAEAWTRELEQGPVSLPVTLLDLRTDPDPRIRETVLRLAATSGAPDTVTWLEAALNDSDLGVRQTALLSLGRVQSAEALTILQHQLDSRLDTVRATAVTALAQAQQWESVLAAGRDEAWRVRAAVATALRDHPAETSARLAATLLTDDSVEVQQRVIEAVQTWPNELSGPLLLTALERGSYIARKSATAELAKRWPPAAAFAPDSPPERRQAMLDELRAQWATQFGTQAEQFAAAAGPATTVAHSLLTPQQQQLLRQSLQVLQDPAAPPANVQKAAESIVSLGPSAVEELERTAKQWHQSLPNAVYERVLPQLAPEYQLLAGWGRLTIEDRRRAMEQLKRLSADAPLSELVLARLAQILPQETDPLVWLDAWQMLEDDERAAAIELARVAITHPSPEIRRRACEYLGEHFTPEYAAQLVPALQDVDPAVVRAAVHALSRPGGLSDPAPLEALLNSADRTLRVEAAEALVAMDIPSGVAALERLAHDADERVRQQAAAAMGRLHDSRFAATLVELLDDPLSSVSGAALAALPEVSASSPQPAESELDAAGDRRAARIRRWKDWWLSNQPNPALQR
jgi:HEAT repeat protein